ncbi:MAG TPA: hypothetical protein VEM96_00125 [Pyrinomonadaceae bacterium]|nr:hypothetical protein [Pyrinomonadaceae bacterium]
MNDNPSEHVVVLPAAALKHLQELRRNLLHLHKTLLDMERADFERISGRLTSGELLQLVINHAQFAWLRQISALVVQMDEMLGAEEPATKSDVDNLLDQARLLFTSSADKTFREKYQAALQRAPAAVMAHAEIAKLLRGDDNAWDS